MTTVATSNIGNDQESRMRVYDADSDHLSFRGVEIRQKGLWGWTYLTHKQIVTANDRISNLALITLSPEENVSCASNVAVLIHDAATASGAFAVSNLDVTFQSGTKPESKARARNYREVELNWLENDHLLLKSHAGHWIVVEGEAIIASGKSYSKTRRAAIAKGIDRPFIFYVPEHETEAFMGI